MSPFVKLVAAALCVAVAIGVALLARAQREPTKEQQPVAPAVPQPDTVADPASGFKVAPYLQFPTRTGITVMCETFEPTTCTIAYGTSVPGTMTVSNDKPGTMHELRLDKLTPKTRYFYQVTCTTADGKNLPGKWLSFFTAPDADDAWSFTVIGDTQRNPTVTGQLAKLMWERRPNFVLHCGDVVDSGPDNKQWTGDLFTPCLELFGRVAVMPCIGNHEKNHAHYYQYFSLPKPEYYYSFKYGNAEFFSIDTNKKVGPGTE